MRHIATTNAGETIVALKIEDINEMMMFVNSAGLRYMEQAKTSIDAEGRRYQAKRADEWWRKLYDLRNELK